MKKPLFNFGKPFDKIRSSIAAIILCLSTAVYPGQFDITQVIGKTPAKYITSTEVQMIFTGKTSRWADGTPIQIIVLPRNSPVTLTFLREHLKMTPGAYFDYVNHYNLSGKSNKIIIAEDEYDMVSKMKNSINCGCIGYLSDVLLIKLDNEIKIIEIR